MRAALIVIVAVAEVVSWRIVARRGKANEWNLMIAVFFLQGVVGLSMWHIEWCSDSTIRDAVLLGLGSGSALYAATRAFVAVALRVPIFRAHVADRYERAALVPLPVAVAIAVVIAAPGEELFWRGLVQGLGGAHSTEFVGAALAWAGYIAVKSATGSLPLIAAAVVGGLAWGVVTIATGGILAAVMCHGVWTALMLAFPPRSGRALPGAREMMPG
ncbi:MAG: protease family protein [Actinomycetota bacterium]|nr:protease family protein [Actinomycetota bacterium]